MMGHFQLRSIGLRISTRLRAVSMPRLSGQPGAISIFRNANANPSRLHLQTASGVLQGRRRHFHSEPTLNPDTEADSKTVLAWLRATDEGVICPKLVVPDKIPYKKYMGKYSTALITKSETERYLRPLFYRGWDIRTMEMDDGFNKPGPKSPFLVGSLVMNSSSRLGVILEYLVGLQESEKHHVSFSVSAGRQPVLTVITQTHTARKDTSALSETSDSSSIEPGITLRDIRIAALLETVAFASTSLFHPKSTITPADIDLYMRKKKIDWEVLLSRYPWQ